MAVWLHRFRLDCQTCTIVQKRYRGCEAEALQPFYLDIKGKKEELKRCPRKLITLETMRIFRYFNYYKEGFLPFNGSVDQQSDVLFQAFEIIRSEQDKIKELEERGRQDGNIHKRPR